MSVKIHVDNYASSFSWVAPLIKIITCLITNYYANLYRVINIYLHIHVACHAIHFPLAYLFSLPVWIPFFFFFKCGMQWSNQTKGSMNDEPRIKTDHTNVALRLSTGFDSDRLMPRSGRRVDLIRIQPSPTCLILFWFQRSSKTQLGRQRGRWEISGRRAPEQAFKNALFAWDGREGKPAMKEEETNKGFPRAQSLYEG